MGHLAQSQARQLLNRRRLRSGARRAMSESHMKPSRPTIIAVGFDVQDRGALRRAVADSGYALFVAATISNARMLLAGRTAPVIVCERNLPDGTWKDLLGIGKHVIVVCQHADEALWAEVLSRGGHDVLASPLEEREVLHALGSACRPRRCLEAAPVEWANVVVS